MPDAGLSGTSSATAWILCSWTFCLRSHRVCCPQTSSIYGTWTTAITVVSEGVDRALATSLAQEGARRVLLARNLDRLEEPMATPTDACAVPVAVTGFASVQAAVATPGPVDGVIRGSQVPPDALALPTTAIEKTMRQGLVIAPCHFSCQLLLRQQLQA